MDTVRADGKLSGQVSRKLARRDGRVRLEVPVAMQRRSLYIGEIAPGAVLEVVWVRDGEPVDDAFVRLCGRSGEATAERLVKVTTWGDGALGLTIDGPLRLSELRVASARVHLTGGADQQLDSLHLERDAGLKGCRICGVTIGASGGRGVVRDENGELMVVGGQGLALNSSAGGRGPIVNIADISDSQIDGIRVRLTPGSNIVNCSGTIRLVSCIDALVVGSPTDRLVVGAAFESEEPDNEDDFLRNSVFMLVALEGDTLSAFLSASGHASIIDPLPETVRDSLQAVPDSIRESIAELMLQRLSEKAPRPQAVDMVASLVLEMRRARTRPWTLDWLLLEAFRVLGYGRVIARPLSIWAGLVVAILTLRLANGLCAPSGLLTSSGVAENVDLGDLLYAGFNVVLTVMMLPLTWIRGDATAEVVGLSGGYLATARVALAIPIVFAIGAARSRLRVRPAALSH